MSSSATAEEVSQRRGRGYTQQTPYRTCHICRERVLIFSKQADWSFFWGGGRERRCGAEKNIKGREHCACSPERPNIGAIEKAQGGFKVRVVTCCSPKLIFHCLLVTHCFQTFLAHHKGGNEFDTADRRLVALLLFIPPDCTSALPPSSSMSSYYYLI